MFARSFRLPALACAIAVVAALAACADGAETADTADTAAGTTTSASTDVTDIREYELEMDQVDKYYAAFGNIAEAMSRMTPAEREALNMDAGQSNLDAYIANLERSPQINSAIRDAGLSAREFSMILWSMLQSGMASAVLQMRPNDNQDSLVREMNANMDNVEFMREHEAELKQKQQALEARMRALGLEDEESESDSM